MPGIAGVAPWDIDSLSILTSASVAIGHELLVYVQEVGKNSA